MAQYCPYHYKSVESGPKRDVVQGSDECLAWARPLCLDCTFAGPSSLKPAPIGLPPTVPVPAEEPAAPPAAPNPAVDRPLAVLEALKADLVGQAIRKLRLGTGMNRPKFADWVGASTWQIVALAFPPETSPCKMVGMDLVMRREDGQEALYGGTDNNEAA